VQENKTIEEGKWNYFYSNIQGFEYESGIIYRIKVQVYKAPEPIPDYTTSHQYNLNEVEEKYPDLF
jgi:heat shock protein HslJ